MSKKALNLLGKYSWPGNVRELKNLLERLAIMIEKDVIDASNIPSPYNPDAKEDKQPVEKQLFLIDSLKDAKKIFEEEFLKKKLLQNDNNITQTAKVIGVQRSFLSKKLKHLQ